MNFISPSELSQLINSSDEIAVIDVREQGEFGKEHILLCANIPLSHLEIKVPVWFRGRVLRLSYAILEVSCHLALSMCSFLTDIQISQF